MDERTERLDERGATPKTASSRRIPTPEQAIALCIAVVVAIAGIALLASFALSGTQPTEGADVAAQMANRYESDTRIAARVDDATITEGQVTTRVMTFRVSNGLEDDAAWSGWLAIQGMSPQSVRSYVLERLVTERIVREEAEKMEVEVTDEQLSGQVAKNREAYVADWEGATDEYLEERWTQATTPTQLDGLAYEDRTRELMLEAEVARAVARQGMSFEQWYGAQLEARKVEYLEMPDDLPYVT